jgi:hypothetical protein
MFHRLCDMTVVPPVLCYETTMMYDMAEASIILFYLILFDDRARRRVFTMSQGRLSSIIESQLAPIVSFPIAGRSPVLQACSFSVNSDTFHTYYETNTRQARVRVAPCDVHSSF